MWGKTMNKTGIIVFIFLGLIFNAAGMYISDTLISDTFLHPSGIGFIAGVVAMSISDVIGEILG